MTDVIDVLSDLFILRGVPGHVRSDNGPEFIAKAVREWIAAVGARTAFIEPGSPWENGYCESFNSKLRDELLNGEVFYSLAEARIVIESWRQHYNTLRPHSSLGYRPPAPPAVLWPAAPRHQPWPLSPPCIRFDPGHLMGAGQRCIEEQVKLVACPRNQIFSSQQLLTAGASLRARDFVPDPWSNRAVSCRARASRRWSPLSGQYQA